MQAPYKVHADISGGDAPMRDTARFHFGFTVPYVPHDSAAGVIDAVADSAGDLGVFRAEPGRSAGRVVDGAGRARAGPRSSRACPSSSGRTIRRARRSM